MFYCKEYTFSIALYRQAITQKIIYQLLHDNNGRKRLQTLSVIIYAMIDSINHNKYYYWQMIKKIDQYNKLIMKYQL